MESLGYELDTNEYKDLINYLPVNGKLPLTLDLYMRISERKSGFVPKNCWLFIAPTLAAHYHL